MTRVSTGKGLGAGGASDRQLVAQVEAERRRMAVEMLRQLIERVESRLTQLQSFIPELSGSAVLDYLTTRERGYPELAGRLSRAHPHRTNVFDLDELRVNGQSWPTERLYELLHGGVAADEDSDGPNPPLARFLIGAVNTHGDIALSPAQSPQPFADRLSDYVT